MACTSCGVGKDGIPKGCKSNGSCGTSACNKLSVFDWLANMSLPEDQEPFPFVEIQFKNSRKEFYRNTLKDSSIQIGDLVAVEASPGHDLGQVTLTGELVRVQMRKKNVSESSPEIKKIYRKATQRDIDVWQKAREEEAQVQKKARELALALDLEMKISDVEFQGDGTKATFYYTAEQRVDFRQLIKNMALAFSVRIEMKQVGYRQEAARLGGIGSCGRELCCSTWLTDYRVVSTAAARYQQLALNPQKLAGQCGKLKCCLNYELDSYLEAIKKFPSSDIKLKTDKGIAVCQKIDIFKELMWYAYEGQWMNWYSIKAEVVNEIIAQNGKGNAVTSLEDFIANPNEDGETAGYANVVGQDSLTRFDTKSSKKGNRKNRKSSGKNRNESKLKGNA